MAPVDLVPLFGTTGTVRLGRRPPHRRGPIGAISIEFRVVLLAYLLLAGTALAQFGGTPSGTSSGVVAPEFPDGLEWLNSDRPLELAEMRGKIVLLDFLTYGCINCIHVIPDLHALEEKYADELVVIGVHSAKFEHERDTENIRRFAERYGVDHPIVNDRDFAIWRDYGIYAWPSSVLIDPEGRVAGHHAGEGVFEVFDRTISAMVDRFEARGTLERRKLDLSDGRSAQPDSPLRFPGKVLADQPGNRLFIADTNHHRIVVTTLDGRVLDVIGSGEAGFIDGAANEARFLRPRGMALSGGDTLYVADTGNHSIRRIDLASGEVSTAAGSGEQEYIRSFRQARPATRGLNSPWDLAVHGGQLYIAMAGQHQLWRFDPAEELLYLFAGSGREALLDGPLEHAGLNQPSGLASDGTAMYVADSEASAIRRVGLGAHATVTTLVGIGLFEFGDIDGTGNRVRLQHPEGIAAQDGAIYIADTYNNKIKRFDPESGTTSTVLGSGERGWRDGAEPLFYEPAGISIAGNSLFIADTNNHAVRVADLDSGSVRTLLLDDARGLLAQSAPAEFFGQTVELPAQQVAPGAGSLALEIVLPENYKTNTLAPLSIEWQSDGASVTVDPGRARTDIHEPEYPLALEFPAHFSPGDAEVTAELRIYYCREGAEALCLVDRVRLSVPVSVTEGAGKVVELTRRPPPVPATGL
ncbi:MAG: thioredoxin-like domain-containing protein [Trueperaceae bacterium]